MRARSILRIELLTGWPAADGAEWAGGEICNPENGKTYRSELELEAANTLEVRGCVFIFCETQTWTRVKQAAPQEGIRRHGFGELDLDGRAAAAPAGSA